VIAKNKHMLSLSDKTPQEQPILGIEIGEWKIQTKKTNMSSTMEIER
jgi:hypothetical protein